LNYDAFRWRRAEVLRPTRFRVPAVFEAAPARLSG